MISALSRRQDGPRSGDAVGQVEVFGEGFAAEHHGARVAEIGASGAAHHAVARCGLGRPARCGGTGEQALQGDGEAHGGLSAVATDHPAASRTVADLCFTMISGTAPDVSNTSHFDQTTIIRRMPVSLAGQLVVAISSRALFD